LPSTHSHLATQVSRTGSALTSPLMQILMADDVGPGSDPDYQLCKTIYVSHPLGQKMAESPISMAQSQQREVTIQDAPPEVLSAFLAEWEKLTVDAHIHNVMRLSRAYGLASIALGCEGKSSNEELDMWKIWDLPIFINEFDPLNSAGSLVLNQIPTSPDFNKPARLVVNGQEFHRSRYQVVMNEQPVYLSYTSSAFGFVGRSVYQRALFPLKSFIRSMIADDMIATKLGLLVAKQKAPGSIITKAMEKIAGIKRALLREAQTGQVLSIDTEEEVETLNMQNVDGAGTYSRTNILKNVATAADMPAKLLENETMVAGFGEGVEDAKNIARYIERVRIWMNPVYRWFDNIVQYRAWNEVFYKQIQAKYPDQYGKLSLQDAFSQWRQSFSAIWPSFLIEPESEQIKREDVKLQALVAVVQTLLPELDPANGTACIAWLADNIGDNKRLFQHELTLDLDELKAHLEKRAKQLESGQGEPGEEEGQGGEAKKFGRFDVQGALARLSDRVARLPDHRARPAAR
jgi:hypothetical protein